MSKFNPTVIKIIVENNICIGCGVCAGLCPAQTLTMKFNEYGEYIPIESPGCLEKCDLCLRVCPFYDQSENEDSLARISFGNINGIMRQSETGYYLNSYVGYSDLNDQRANGASGGMATWILETSLRKNLVDHVICVTPNDDHEKLFRFSIFDDVTSIRRSAKSAYYPVEMSGVVKVIIANKGRYAVTGVPCFLKALRLAAKRNRKLRERVVLTVGLICGQMKNKGYTHYLASLSGVSARLQKVNYRGKSTDKPASNFFFHCVDEKNDEGRLFWDEGVGEAWLNRWFTPTACNFCDDVFSELADVALMDAWLPEYSRDSRGTNLLISRSPMVSDLLDQGKKERQIIIEDISIEKIIQAQIGVLHVKRKHLGYRLYGAKQRGLHIPNKRVASSKRIGFFNKKEVELKDKMQALSRELYLKHYSNENLEMNVFSAEIRPLIKKLDKWNHVGRIVRFPVRVLRKTRRILLGHS